MNNDLIINYDNDEMKNLELKILESEYKRRKMFPVNNGQEKEYLKKLRFHINLNGKAIKSPF